MKPTDFDRKMFFSTVRLTASDGLDRINGTGFIVRIESHGNPALAYAIVTCKHVLYGEDGSVAFMLHTWDTHREVPVLVDGIKVGPQSFGANYFEHDNPKIDVAAIDITDVIKNPKVYAWWVHPEMISETNLQYIGPNRDALFMGYPSDLYDKKHNLPIMRAARVATIPEVDFDGDPCYIIDAHVFEGSSGSPVFASDPKGQSCFVGMIGESFERWNKVILGKKAHESGIGIYEKVGLGVVYKPRVIMDVLNKVKTAALARL